MNNESDRGGAIFSAAAFGPAGDHRIQGCLFTANTANNGGAVYSDHTSPLITNCTFAGNSASSSGGAIETSGLPGEPTLTNVVVWGNTATTAPGISGPATVAYSDIQDGWPGPGNIAADPLFVDAFNGDFRLAASSPCIDAGHNWGVLPDVADLDGDGDVAELTPFDLAGAPRFANDPAFAVDTGCGEPAIVDMGAYEFLGIPMEVVYGDIEGNGSVGITDLLLLLAAWGDANDACELADLDLDGDVGNNDLMLMLASWR